ncbi:TIGR01906 family membrane protein [Arthrobacter cryoconiti]|uniref:TIGR01906 family membrane protein n=1 Tax=Arthrobacter cryoconiti TaxID=748907 RepID=A0ABV8R660_9MICC|nr:TIGR01906 family membrane protein [Arthrobacter cryoconiti]MCC9066988.1 TIGR01906 family membrane protein [Arthrobacter cryoconiti]
MRENQKPQESAGEKPGSDRADALAKIKLAVPTDGSEPEPMRPAGRMLKLPLLDEKQDAVDAGAVSTAPSSSERSVTAASTAAASTNTASTAAASTAADSTAADSTAADSSAAGAATHRPSKAASKAEPQGPSAVYEEQSPTSMLQISPAEKDLAKTRAALEQAANTKPVLTRVFQVLLAVFYPVVLLVVAIRLVTTPIFLWVEYHRPGFPADSFGFSTDDRMTYGSYTVDYLLNFSGSRYLGGLVNAQNNPLFLTREVAHMADVKTVITMAFIVGLVLAAVMVVGMVYLSKRSVGGIRRGLFAGSIATLVLIIALGVLAVLGWEAFFTEFHRIFFANGTWTFYTDDTLIRLFPSDFWTDSGIFIGVFVLVVSSLTMAFTWPTKDRRQAVERAHRPGRRAAVK